MFGLLLPLLGDQRTMVSGGLLRGGDFVRQRRVQVALVGQPQQLGLGDVDVPEAGERATEHRGAPGGPAGVRNLLDAAHKPWIDRALCRPPRLFP
jgi:hypothetical protein